MAARFPYRVPGHWLRSIGSAMLGTLLPGRGSGPVAATLAGLAVAGRYSWEFLLFSRVRYRC
ncbi:hypothetical protein GCM10027258_79770 [Amycolatopsis stemonae]